MSPDTDADLAGLFAEAPTSPGDAQLALAILQRIDAEQRRRRVLLGLALSTGVVLSAALVIASGLVPLASMTLHSAGAKLPTLLSSVHGGVDAVRNTLAPLLSASWLPAVIGGAGLVAALATIIGTSRREALP